MDSSPNWIAWTFWLLSVANVATTFYLFTAPHGSSVAHVPTVMAQRVGQKKDSWVLLAVIWGAVWIGHSEGADFIRSLMVLLLAWLLRRSCQRLRLLRSVAR